MYHNQENGLFHSLIQAIIHSKHYMYIYFVDHWKVGSKPNTST